MAPNVVKELQAKVEFLEKSNGALTERLLQTEHKVGILFQWAMSFPELAASEGLAKFNVQSTDTDEVEGEVENNHVGHVEENVSHVGVSHKQNRQKPQRSARKIKIKIKQPKQEPKQEQKQQTPGRRRSGKYVDYSNFLENDDAELIDLSSDVESKKRKISIPRRYTDTDSIGISNRGRAAKVVTRSIPKTASSVEGNFIDAEDGAEDEKFEDLEHVVLPIVHLSETEPGTDGNFANDVFSKDENDLEEPPDTEESDEVKTELNQSSKSRSGKFDCEICGNSYAYSHGLVRHMNAAHTQTIKFNCKVCDKTFHRRDKFRIHEASCKQTKS